MKYVRCPECHRPFDLRVEAEAEEWHAGHDCEPVQPGSTVFAAGFGWVEVHAIASTGALVFVVRGDGELFGERKAGRWSPDPDTWPITPHPSEVAR